MILLPSPLHPAYMVSFDAYLAQLTAYWSSFGPARFHFMPNCPNSSIVMLIWFYLVPLDQFDL